MLTTDKRPTQNSKVTKSIGLERIDQDHSPAIHRLFFEVYYHLGEACMHCQNDRASLRHFDTAVQLATKHGVGCCDDCMMNTQHVKVAVYIQRAISLARLGHFEQSFIDLQSAHDIDPQNTEIEVVIGLLFRCSKRLSQCIEITSNLIFKNNNVIESRIIRYLALSDWMNENKIEQLNNFPQIPEIIRDEDYAKLQEQNDDNILLMTSSDFSFHSNDFLLFLQRFIHCIELSVMAVIIPPDLLKPRPVPPSTPPRHVQQSHKTAATATAMQNSIDAIQNPTNETNAPNHEKQESTTEIITIPTTTTGCESFPNDFVFVAFSVKAPSTTSRTQRQQTISDSRMKMNIQRPQSSVPKSPSRNYPKPWLTPSPTKTESSLKSQIITNDETSTTPTTPPEATETKPTPRILSSARSVDDSIVSLTPIHIDFDSALQCSQKIRSRPPTVVKVRSHVPKRNETNVNDTNSTATNTATTQSRAVKQSTVFKQRITKQQERSEMYRSPPIATTPPNTANAASLFTSPTRDPPPRQSAKARTFFRRPMQPTLTEQIKQAQAHVPAANLPNFHLNEGSRFPSSSAHSGVSTVALGYRIIPPRY